jgi:hypothetical protein
MVFWHFYGGFFGVFLTGFFKVCFRVTLILAAAIIAGLARVICIEGFAHAKIKQIVLLMMNAQGPGNV